MGCDHSLALGKKTLSLPPRVKKMFPQTGTSAAKVRGFSYGELHRKKKKAIMAHSPLRVTNTTQETPAGTTKGPASTWMLPFFPSSSEEIWRCSFLTFKTVGLRYPGEASQSVYHTLTGAETTRDQV